MSGVVRVFDRAGTEIAEVEAMAVRSWILNDEGDCSFPLSIRDSKAREEIVQYGNLLLIEDAALPDWAGVIDLDPVERVWRGESFTVNGFTLERLLKSGDTPIQKVTGTAGSIFRQIIDFYNQDTDLVILPGEIWLGGTQREETLGDSCFVHIQRVIQRADCDWNISQRIEGGKMKLYANLYEKRGQRTGRLLFDGDEGNLEKLDPALTEAGPIYNVITGYSDASTNGTRLKVTLRDETSRKLFGPRRASMTFSGVTDITTLTKNTQSALDTYAFPWKVTAVNILNKGGIYEHVDLGNIFDVHYSKAGFSNGELGTDAEIRLISLQYSGTPDKVKAGVRVV